MSTLLWVLAIYFTTIAITYNYIKLGVQKVQKKYSYRFFTDRFMTNILASIPIYNLILAFDALKSIRKSKRMTRGLKKILNKYGDRLSKEQKEALLAAANIFEDDTKLENDEDS